VEYDERWTTPERIADAINTLMRNALSTDGVLDDVHNPSIGKVDCSYSQDFLVKPLTIAEIRDQIKNSIPKDNYIHGVVAVDIGEIDSGEAFWDMWSNLLTGTDILEDIDISVVGVTALDGLVLVRVTGDATSILECEE
jgi:hypothetical protein